MPETGEAEEIVTKTDAAQTEVKTEVKTEDVKPTEVADVKKEEKPVEKQVEPVKIELKLSEGSQLTQDELAKISDYASKKGLSQKEAEDLLSEKENDRRIGAESFQKKQEEILKAENKRWIEVGMADPEIGGDKYKESAELAKRVVEKYGTKELIEGLEKSGLGNYHEFVRFVSRIGRQMDNEYSFLIVHIFDKFFKFFE